MEITINVNEETMAELEKIKTYYEVRNAFKGNGEQVTTEELFKGIIKTYLHWLSAKPEPLIENEKIVIGTKIPNIFEKQNKNQTAVSKLTGLSSSTLSNIWNGSVPSLENFIRLWIALGKPPIETILDIKTAD